MSNTDDLIARLSQDLPKVSDGIEHAKFYCTVHASDIREAADALTALTATVAAQARELEALRAQLRLFTGATYPVSTDIDPRGYRWSEAYLDAAMQSSKGTT